MAVVDLCVGMSKCATDVFAYNFIKDVTSETIVRVTVEQSERKVLQPILKCTHMR